MASKSEGVTEGQDVQGINFYLPTPSSVILE